MRRAIVLTALALALLGGCGGSEKLSLHSVPIAKSIHVKAQHYECPVAKEVCFRHAILVPSGRPVAAGTLAQAELRELTSHRWQKMPGATADQLAAVSPDGKLFVSYSTGRTQVLEDRTGQTTWDEKLSTELEQITTQGRPALALTVQKGPGAGP